MQHPPVVRGPGSMPVRKRSKIGRALLTVTGAFGSLFSLPCLVFSLTHLFGIYEASAMSPDAAVAMTAFTLVASVISLAMLFFAFKPEPVQRFVLDADTERQILRIAKGQEGALSLAELVMYSALDTGQAQYSLDELVRKGLATTTFDDDGLMIYRFAGLSRGPARVAHQGNVARSELEAFDRELSSSSSAQLDFSEREQAASAGHRVGKKKS